jgi:hypothetical protein
MKQAIVILLCVLFLCSCGSEGACILSVFAGVEGEDVITGEIIECQVTDEDACELEQFIAEEDIPGTDPPIVAGVLLERSFHDDFDCPEEFE